MVLKLSILLLIGLSVNLCAYEGKGEGATREEAINIALNSIASSISTTISSKLKIYKESGNDSYNRDVEQTIYSDVKDISFNNYTIIKEGKRAEKYFVLLAVDNKKLAEGYSNRINQKLKSLKRELQHPSLLRRYLILNRYNLQELLSQSYLMKSIDFNSPHITYIREIEELIKAKIEYQKQLIFQVISSDTTIANMARSVLNEFSFITSNVGKIKLNITLSPLRVTKIYKSFSATTNATIDIKENSNIVISKTVPLQATSYISKDYLKDEIIKELEVKLKNIIKGVLK